MNDERGTMSDIDLVSAVVRLRPVRAEAGAGAVRSYGRAAHALLLDALRQADPGLAAELHDSPGLKPFTVSDLIGYSPRRGPSTGSGHGLETGRSYSLRFTGLTRAVSMAIQSAVSSGPLAAGSMIRLAEDVFEVEGEGQNPNFKFQISNSQPQSADAGGPESRNPKSQIRDPKSEIPNPQSAWATAATYESLSAPWLLGRAAPSFRVALRFASPTTFKSNEKHVPVPLPGLVFGSLLEKWNAFAPVALPPEARRFAEECMALSGFELRSRPAYLKDGSVRVGAVGAARYTAINRDRYWLSVMNLLADFALFAGVGAGTTMGLGQARRE